MSIWSLKIINKLAVTNARILDVVLESLFVVVTIVSYYSYICSLIDITRLVVDRFVK